MEKQDFLNKITEIGTCNDDTERREMLSALSEEVSKDYDNLSSLTETNQNLVADNEKLRDYNMKLFLRVGEDKTPEQRVEDITGAKPDENKKRSFNDLFNEKGELK